MFTASTQYMHFFATLIHRIVYRLAYPIPLNTAVAISLVVPNQNRNNPNHDKMVTRVMIDEASIIWHRCPHSDHDNRDPGHWGSANRHNHPHAHHYLIFPRTPHPAHVPLGTTPTSALWPPPVRSIMGAIGSGKTMVRTPVVHYIWTLNVFNHSLSTLPVARASASGRVSGCAPTLFVQIALPLSSTDDLSLIDIDTTRGTPTS